MILHKGNRKERRIAAVGMYDGVHRGHRFLLNYLRLEGEARGLKPAAVTFENHPMSLVRPEQAPRLLQTPEAKFAMLQGAGARDVIVLDFDDAMRRLPAKDFLKMLKRRWAIDTLVLGFNNRFGCDRPDTLAQYREIGEKIGVEVIRAPEFRAVDAPVSSSIIRGLVSEGKMREAEALLGRRYTLTGMVVHGRQLGRTIGFPTANLNIYGKVPLLVPGNGVYVGIAQTADGKRYGSVINVGRRPTVEGRDDAPLSVEAHLQGFDGDLYDSMLTLEFVCKLRDERKFKGLESLKKAIAEDNKEARKALHAVAGLEPSAK